MKNVISFVGLKFNSQGVLLSISYKPNVDMNHYVNFLIRPANAIDQEKSLV